MQRVFYTLDFYGNGELYSQSHGDILNAMDLLHVGSSFNDMGLMVIAVALGAFVGLRREIELQEQGVPGFVGFRTMPLVVLLACVTTLVPAFPYLPMIGLAAVIMFLGIAYYNGVFQLQLLGLTSEIATLVMYVVGLLVGYGYIPQAVLVTIFVGVFGAFKKHLHKFARSVSPTEWAGSLQLVIITAVVLPILPREAVDPWGVLVPYDLWLVVILISAIGFIGYFFTKYVGRSKSLVLTSIVGSLVSSTVVTTHLAREARGSIGEKTPLLFAGMLFAIATMLVRISVVVVLLAPWEYLGSLLLVPGAMLASLLLVGLSMWKSGRLKPIRTKDMESPNLKSTFDLVPALQFGGLLVFVLLLTHAGVHYLGSWGIVATTFLSAAVDADAATVSALQSLRSGTLEPGVVALALTVALCVNTTIKALYTWAISHNRTFSLQVLALTVWVSTVGLSAFLFT